MTAKKPEGLRLLFGTEYTLNKDEVDLIRSALRFYAREYNTEKGEVDKLLKELI